MPQQQATVDDDRKRCLNRTHFNGRLNVVFQHVGLAPGDAA